MIRGRLYHDGTPDFLSVERHDPRPGGLDARALVRVRAPKGTLRLAVVTYLDAEERHHQLVLEADTDRAEVWAGELPFRFADGARYRFKAVLPSPQDGGHWFPEWFRGPLEEPRTGSVVAWLNQAGEHDFNPTGEDDFAVTPQQPPHWVAGSVFYQIFPDRFRDGDPSNNPRDGEFMVGANPCVARHWGELPDRSQGGREFFGGDLAGVREGLDHLQSLGVDGVYLNPIFSAPSNHKYDTEDYLTVDPHLGGNAAFRELATAMHQRGMRLVLDGVFNHVGATHPWMNRSGKHPQPGAYQGGETRDHFTYESDDPEAYVSWLGVKSLPKLDFASADVRRKIYQGEESVVRHWLRPTSPNADDGADGWRLDVVHMMGEGGTNRGNHEVLRGLRQAMKRERPDSYLFGEHFYEATPWLQGDLEDGAMNYHGFTWPTWAFLAGADHRGEPARLDAAGYDAALRRARAKLPFATQLAFFNQLDSHDTPRLVSILPDRRLAPLAAALLFTAVGVPCVYYGDEVGLEGGQDPDCRRTMPWDESQWDEPTLALYRALARLRHASPALQRGGWETLHTAGDSLAYQRRLGRERVLVAINRGGEASLTLPVSGEWTDAMSGEAVGDETAASLLVELPGPGFRILRREVAPGRDWA